MPTQNTEKATPGPWKITRDEGELQICGQGPFGNYLMPVCEVFCEGDWKAASEANAALICQAVNERNALLAVAEAAKAVSTSRNEVPRHRKLMDKWLDDALSALAKIQGGKQ